MGRYLLTLPTILAAFLSAAATPAPAGEPVIDYRTLPKEEFKEIPILERHQRPGHFYGNTVRRRYARGVCWFYDDYGNPTTRFAQRMEERK